MVTGYTLTDDTYVCVPKRSRRCTPRPTAPVSCRGRSRTGVSLTLTAVRSPTGNTTPTPTQRVRRDDRRDAAAGPVLRAACRRLRLPPGANLAACASSASDPGGCDNATGKYSSGAFLVP